MKLFVNDAEIFYEVRGNGPTVFLLHPFPANHHFWNQVAYGLEDSFRMIMPDLRGHGESGLGSGPATMERHAHDIAALCDHCGAGKAAFAGVSIGGYVLFEFWRHFSNRVSALVLCDTRPTADSFEAKNERLRSADEVLQRGPTEFVNSMVPKLLGETTYNSRPDLVAEAKGMLGTTSAASIAALLRGMAARPDSIALLESVSVPTLILCGAEDTLTPTTDAYTMNRLIKGSSLRIVQGAGHYAPFEKPEETVLILREFLQPLKLST